MKTPHKVFVGFHSQHNEIMTDWCLKMEHTSEWLVGDFLLLQGKQTKLAAQGRGQRLWTNDDTEAEMKETCR